MTPRRGEIFWIDRDPARGVEQRGRRPGLLVHNEVDNRSSKATVVAAVSPSEVEPFPFMVQLSPGEAGLKKVSHINCWLLDKIGSLSSDRMREVDRALAAYELGLR